MKKLLIAFFQFIFILAISSFVISYSPSKTFADVVGTHQPQVVDENTPTVTIMFSGLSPGTDYNISNGVGMHTADSQGNLSVVVCGDKEKLKTKCDPSTDYFHGGITYTAAITNKNVPGSVSFGVNYIFPTVGVAPQNPAPGDTINISLQGGVKTVGGKSNVRNNYAVSLANTDNPSQYSQTKCVTVTNGFSPIVQFDSVPEGVYTLDLLEQTGDDNSGALDYTIGGRPCKSSGGYLYDTESIQVLQGGGTLGGLVQDPNNVEEGLAAATPTAPPPPCPYDAYNQRTGECSYVDTGLGIKIDTDPAGFVQSIFGLLLGISGGVAILLIIISGYQMAMSRGKPETLQAARDRLTSAIVGLLFLIFSLAILQIIGVDILHIPGFDTSVVSHGGGAAR